MAIHASVLGTVLMVALAERVQAPLKHALADLLDALVGGLSGT